MRKKLILKFEIVTLTAFFVVMALFVPRTSIKIFAVNRTVSNQETLINEIASATAGDKIVIVANIELSKTIAVNKDITLIGDTKIDGSKYIIALAETITGRHFTSSTNLTIENLTFNGGNIGGGVNSTAAITVRSCEFVNNKSTSSGGAVSSSLAATIADSNFFNNSTNFQGGAVFSYNDISVENSNFRNNATVGPIGDGGAIKSNTKAIITNCIFENNSATNSGGAVNCADAVVSESIFRENTAVYGGGVYVLGPYGSNYVPRFNNCEFYKNQSTGTYNGGGALHINNFAVTINNSIFSENSASNTDGGAVFCFESATIIDSTFNNNKSFGHGGALYIYKELTIVRCSFTANESKKNGGAAYAAKITTIFDSSFTANVAQNGAGVFTYNSNLSVTNSTFYKNKAVVTGGAVMIYHTASNELELTATFNNVSCFDNNGNSLPDEIAKASKVSLVLNGSITNLLSDASTTVNSCLDYTDAQNDIYENPNEIATNVTNINIGVKNEIGVYKNLALDYLPIKLFGSADDKIDFISATWLSAKDQLGHARSTTLADIGAIEITGKIYIEKVSGDNQAATVNQSFLESLTAKAYFLSDFDGKAIPIQNYTFTISTPTSGAQAILSENAILTNADGLASVSIVANDIVGSYEIIFTGNQYDDVTLEEKVLRFSLVNISGDDNINDDKDKNNHLGFILLIIILIVCALLILFFLAKKVNDNGIRKK